MKRILIALTTLTLVFGTVQAASFRTQDASVETTLAVWHSEGENLHTASYTHSSLSEVVDGYWSALHGLGYSGRLEEVGASSTTYVFEGLEGTLEATFALEGENVTATLARRQTLS